MLPLSSISRRLERALRGSFFGVPSARFPMAVIDPVANLEATLREASRNAFVFRVSVVVFADAQDSSADGFRELMLPVRIPNSRRGWGLCRDPKSLTCSPTASIQWVDCGGTKRILARVGPTDRSQLRVSSSAHRWRAPTRAWRGSCTHRSDTPKSISSRLQRAFGRAHRWKVREDVALLGRSAGHEARRER